jgi:hypothetical protein
MWNRTIGMVAVVGAAVAVLTGCFPEDGPSTKDIPPTDELSTETSVSATTTTRSTTANRSSGLTLATAISTATRVNNSDFHEAALEGGRLEDTSEFHFSTPDSAVNCSTVERDVPTLACDVTDTPVQTRDYCNWEAGYIVLTDTATQGTCADTPWVWTRGSVLPFGSTISVGTFQCLSDFSGLYCLNTRSDNGFALRDGAYRTVSGADPAPAALTDGAEASATTSGR